MQSNTCHQIIDTRKKCRPSKIIISLIALIMLSSCYMDVSKSPSLTSASTSKTSTTTVTAATTSCANCSKVGNTLVKGVAGIMALELFDFMILAGCNTLSAATIALGFFDLITLGLVETVDADEPLVVGPYLAKGAVAALAKSDFILPDGKSKEDMIKAIIGGTFRGLGSHDGYGLTATEQQALLNSFVSSATSGLVDAELADKKAAVAAIASEMIASLNEAGMVEQDFTALVHDLMASLVGNLKNAGITDATTMSDACSQATRAAIASLGDAGVTDKTVLDTLITQVSQGAVVGLKDLGLSADEQSQISVSIASGVAKGMSDAGYSADEISTRQSQLNTEITSELIINGVSPQVANQAKNSIQNTISGIISGLGK